MADIPIASDLAFGVSILEDLSDSIYIASSEGSPLVVNKSFRYLFKCHSIEYFSEKGGLSTIFDDINVLDSIRCSINNKTIWEGNVKLKTFDEEGFIGRVKVSPIIDSSGGLRGVTFCFKRILSVYNNDYVTLLESFIQNANDSVMVTEAEPLEDPGPRIIYVNPTFTQVTGYSEEEVLGRNPRFLQGPKTDPQQLRIIRESLKSKRPFKVELINYRKNGEEFYVDLSFVPIKNSEGNVTHFVSIQRETTERKIYENKLNTIAQEKHQVNHLLSGILDALPAHLAVVNKEGMILSVNQAWKKFAEENRLKAPNFGINQNYLLVCENSHEDAKEIGEELKKVISGQKDFYTQEYPCHTAEKLRWFKLMVTPLYSEYPTDIVVMHVDITDRKLAEIKILESEQHFKLLFEQNHDPVCSLDLDGTYLNVNDALVINYGIPREEIVNRKFSDFMGPAESEPFWTYFKKACTGETVIYDARVEKFSGGEMFIHVTLIPIYRQGEISFIYCIVKDITVEKQAQKLLEESNNSIKDILESIDSGFFTIDKDFKIKYWNKVAEQICGIPKEAVLGQCMWDIFPEAVCLKYREEYIKAIKEKKPVHFEELYPNEIWTEVSAYPNEHGLSIYFKDITERKREQENLEKYARELEKINHELDQFVYRTSHDLRAPLVSVLGLINISQMENNATKKDEYLNLMSKSINKLDKFIQDIIYYSKNSRTDISIAAIDLRSFIADIIEDVKYMDEAKSISFKVSVNYNELFYTDVSRLSVILSNIISNAIRYHDAAKEDQFIEILVNSSNKEDTIQIDVNDNGQGIPVKDQDKIFDMFYRANLNTVGSGLGLYLVSENLKKLNGSIDVKSEYGKGTTFSMAIPNAKGGN